MRRLCMLLAAAGLVSAIALPASAGPQCAAYFASMGRTFVPHAPVPPSPFEARDRILDCPPDQLMQFAHDYLATKEARAVASAHELVGTWVSDDFLGIVAGVFIPVYEVLEIAPGEVEGEIRVVQKLYRWGDPAETWFGDNQLMPPVDVVAAGRFATYGEHRAVLAAPGSLEPRRVRYFDFPLDDSLYTDLAMRLRMGSFLQTQPIGVRSNGERLVFEFRDRMAPGGSRVMTYRKRDARLPRAAMLMILMGEMSSIHFHCIMQAMEGPRPAFADVLGAIAFSDFLDALEEGFAIGMEMEDLRKSASPDMTKDERKAFGEKFLALAEKSRALFESGPLAPVISISTDPGIIGCRTPF